MGRGYLVQSQGRFPVVGLGPRADEALDPLRTGEFAFTVKKRASKSRSAGRARRAVELVREEAALDARPRVGDDAELFEELRDLRPATREELLEVTGIGEKKADAYGAAFLTAIADYEASMR